MKLVFNKKRLLANLNKHRKYIEFVKLANYQRVKDFVTGVKKSE